MTVEALIIFGAAAAVGAINDIAATDEVTVAAVWATILATVLLSLALLLALR